MVYFYYFNNEWYYDIPTIQKNININIDNISLKTFSNQSIKELLIYS